MIKGISKEEVYNAEILMNTFIRNKTGKMMVRIQFSESSKVHAKILADLELDGNLKKALRCAKQILQLLTIVTSFNK